MDRYTTTALQAVIDVLPIVLVILFFQIGILRSKPHHLRRIALGSSYALIGLILFRLGLDDTLLPLGSEMASALAHHGELPINEKQWFEQYWLVLFAGLIGLAATLIEPTLLAIANRVQELSGGEIRAMDLRLVVAGGVAVGLALGTLRIIIGIPILWLVAPMVILTLLMALAAPGNIVPLALDTGPMATSVVTVPLIAAFGSSIAQAIPNRDPVMDGFGLIFFALMMPVLSLLTFTLIKQMLASRNAQKET